VELTQFRNCVTKLPVLCLALLITYFTLSMHNYSGHLFNFGYDVQIHIIKTYVVKALYTRVFLCILYILDLQFVFAICLFAGKVDKNNEILDEEKNDFY